MEHEFDELSGKTIEAALAVHRALGPGFVEPIYQQAMQVSLFNRSIPFERQKRFPIQFEGIQVGLHRLDLVVGGELIAELKAVKALEDIHFAQLRSYLKATGLHVGLLLNFSTSTLTIKRVVL